VWTYNNNNNNNNKHEDIYSAVLIQCIGQEQMEKNQEANFG